jgi:hypothetical protein
VPTVFTAFDQAVPTTAQTRQAAIDAARNDLFALAASMICSGVLLPGWTYTNSVTRGLGSPGTAAQPNIIFFTKGSGGATQWVKAVLTWNGVTGNVDKVALYYSSDNEGTYALLADGAGNYVLHLSYDGSGNLTATTWDAIP